MKELIDKIASNYFHDGISENKRLDIINFILNKFYTEYQEYCMKREILAKNKIDGLEIIFPNGKAGVTYSHLIKIEDEDIIEYWIEGLENIGFNIESENDNLPAEEDSDQNNPTSCSCESLETNNLPAEEISIVGLQYKQKLSPTIIIGNNNNGIVIKGTPSSPGDYDITLKCKFKGLDDNCNILERKFRLIVNPDPRSLWKDIPTSKDIKFYKDDCTCEYITVPANEKGAQKDIVAASKRGRSHANEGKPRDDDFKLFYNSDNGWYVIAVADGAGSAKYSRKGSAVACETSVEYCKQALETPEELENAIISLNSATTCAPNKIISDLLYRVVGNAAHKAYRAILKTASTNGDKPKDYSTTLLLTICKKFDFGWFIASFWVGDGAMCVYNKDQQYIKLLGTPDGGEYAGQTRFLTMPEIFSSEALMSRLKYSIENDFTALLLMTDGISDPFFETDANLNKIEKWNDLWDNIRSKVDLQDDHSETKEQLLNWLDFWSKGNHDDRTIAILY